MWAFLNRNALICGVLVIFLKCPIMRKILDLQWKLLYFGGNLSGHLRTFQTSNQLSVNVRFFSLKQPHS